MRPFKKETEEIPVNEEETAEKTEDEKVNVRHTITAEETFTLAKDVYDIRCLIKNIYNNRAVISRRMNIVTLCAGAIFTLIYVAYMLISGLMFKLSLGVEIFVYALIGVWAAICLTLVIIMASGGRGGTRGAKKISLALKIFRFLSRVATIAISITALTFSVTGGEYAASQAAADIIIIIFSILMLVIQLVPMLFGGVAKLARWLLSPVKIKYRFSYVLLEWYNLTVPDKSKAGKRDKSKEKEGKVKKVDKRYYEQISAVVDEVLIPSLGQKYITAIKPTVLLTVAENVSQEDKPIVEGVLKSVFEYAEECGYITFNPCRDLKFQGDIEEKKKTTIKDRFVGIGKKIGMNVLDKFIPTDED